MKKLKVNSDIIQDALNIKNGVYAPLTSFLYKKDFLSVMNNMRLDNGGIWSIPIILDINKRQARELQNGEKIKIYDEKGNYVIINNIEKYNYDKEELAEKVYGTTSIKHPSVAGIMNMGDVLVGGEIADVNIGGIPFSDYFYTPAETKKIFKDKGWNSIVAFQTRNVPHCGHEFLQKQALSKVDGLMIQPVIGEKKLDDFKDEYIISAYKILIDKYFSKNKVFLSILPLKMRYAGPREALMHAIIRRNFGCTHFIVGRDHAGAGDFYHPQAAQDIFDNYKKEELGIEIFKFNEVVYDKKAEKHNFIDSVKKPDIIKFSGTLLRNLIKNKEEPPKYFMRPEVYNFLVNSQNSLVDNMYKENNNKKGFVLWLTGLSAAGKTTVADKIYEIMGQNGLKLERLDGDVVRENLANLGFSKEDRDQNIKRVGFVANLLARNGIGVIASFISPYTKQREKLHKTVHNYIEVFIDAPLVVCEQRDPKGMYKKARAGEIKNFTGISDPYEEPRNPDIHLDTANTSPEECAEKVLGYLRENGHIK